MKSKNRKKGFEERVMYANLTGKSSTGKRAAMKVLMKPFLNLIQRNH